MHSRCTYCPLCRQNYYHFKLLYNLEPVLLIDIKYSLLNTENCDHNDPFNMGIFDSLLVFANTIRKEIHENASENIQTSQKKQKTNYEKKLPT